MKRKIITYVRDKKWRKSQNILKSRNQGYQQTFSKYRGQNCIGCPKRGACFKSKNNQIVERNHHLEHYNRRPGESII